MRLSIAILLATITVCGLGRAEELASDKVIAMAGELIQKGDTAAAFQMYRSSLQAKDSIDVRRAYGAACYKLALESRAKLEPQIEPKKAALQAATEKAYKKVSVAKNANATTSTRNGHVSASSPGASDYTVFDPTYPPMLKAQHELEELQRELDKGNALLTEGITQFRAVLRLNKNSDVNATAHIALCSAAHPMLKGQGKILLHDFIVKYASPANPDEKACLDECSKAYEAMLK